MTPTFLQSLANPQGLNQALNLAATAERAWTAGGLAATDLGQGIIMMMRMNTQIGLEISVKMKETGGGENPGLNHEVTTRTMMMTATAKAHVVAAIEADGAAVYLTLIVTMM